MLSEETDIEPTTFAVQLCDQIDGVVCYTILCLLLLYSFWMWLHEVVFIRKSQTLRTFILLLTLLNSALLCLYTLMARLFDAQWSDLAEDSGDLLIAVVSFCQYYFVLVWFSRILAAIDDEFRQALDSERQRAQISAAGNRQVASWLFGGARELVQGKQGGRRSSVCTSPHSFSPSSRDEGASVDCYAGLESGRQNLLSIDSDFELGHHQHHHHDISGDLGPWWRVPVHLFFITFLLCYLTTGIVLLATQRITEFRLYQDIVTFAGCLFYFALGTYYILSVHAQTNVLDISAESYSVIRRSKTTVYVLGACAVFATVLSGLSLFMREDYAASYGNAMETKYYSCHRIPCLVNFLIRVIFLVTLPNWALAFTFSSPSEPNLHLVPIERSGVGQRTAAGGRYRALSN